SIDATGLVPGVFRDDREANPFEQKLWSRFWEYVNNPALAAGEGVRIAQGEAVYVRMRAGQQWSLSLEHNGGLNIKLIRSQTEGINNGSTLGSFQGDRD